MILRRAAKRYGRALFEKAREQERLDAVLEDLGAVVAAMERSPRVAEVVRTPILAPQVKKEALAQALGREIDPLVLDFLKLLVDKRRMNLLAACLEEYRAALDDYRGLLRVEVASAVALLPEEESRLIHILETQSGKRVLLSRRLDPSLLGGVVVRYDDTLVDGSVLAQLQRLRNRLRQVKVV